MKWLLALVLLLGGCTAAVNYTPQYDPATVKVLNLNFGGAAGGNVQGRLNQVASLVASEGVDVVCLQEAPGGGVGWMLHGTKDAVQTLAGQVGHESASHVTWDEFGLQYRTGITSRWRLTGAQGLYLSYSKGATVAKVGDWQVASCHFSQEAPEEHLKAVLDAFKPGPGIIAGDMNCYAPRLSEAAKRAGFIEVPLPSGAGGADRVFVRGFEVVGAKTVLTEVSDHNGVLVTLKRR